MSKIGPSTLDQYLVSGDVFILDVRPREDYWKGHIEGSSNAPVYDDLQRGDTESLDSYLDDIPDDSMVVTVCKAGIVARKATDHLNEQGYEAVTLTGGFTGWRHYDEKTLVYRIFSVFRSLAAWTRNLFRW